MAGQYLLAIDVGNTNAVFGMFEGETLVGSWRLATAEDRTADEYAAMLMPLCAHAGLRREAVGGAVIASVVPPLTPIMTELVERYWSVTPLLISHSLHTGLVIKYDRPGEVGADRICDAVATKALYGSPSIFIDFGTATTFNAIDAAGDYLGGAIAPGINLSMEALARYAAQLHRIELVAPPSAIGRNTVHAMQSGVFLGYLGLVESMTERFQHELGGRARVIATGGLSTLIGPATPMIEIIDPLLTIKGLRMIWEMNRSRVG
ncbi:MAG: putative transcriptional acitvator, Baf family [Chloroflexi bacterium]|jgi:type III pantothenate kinase|nr:putative transcriptional acitvator, Baf family [Chloroflexota bacterium]